MNSYSVCNLKDIRRRNNMLELINNTFSYELLNFLSVWLYMYIDIFAVL